MTVTCCIMSYYYGHLAAHCIESVLAQTKKFDQVVFVDDGAGDCAHLQQYYPEVSYVLREQNLGIVENFSKTLAEVKTDRVIFIGADNWLRQDALEILLREPPDIPKRPPADIVTYDINVVGDLAKERRQQFRLHEGGFVWDRSSGHHGSMLYSPETALACGGYGRCGEEHTATCEDAVLYDRMISNGATRRHVADALIYYRRHRTNYNNIFHLPS